MDNPLQSSSETNTEATLDARLDCYALAMFLPWPCELTFPLHNNVGVIRRGYKVRSRIFSLSFSFSFSFFKVLCFKLCPWLFPIACLSHFSSQLFHEYSSSLLLKVRPLRQEGLSNYSKTQQNKSKISGPTYYTHIGGK